MTSLTASHKTWTAFIVGGYALFVVEHSKNRMCGTVPKLSPKILHLVSTVFILFHAPYFYIFDPTALIFSH